MKKSRFTSALLVLALITTAAPIAAQEKTKEQKISFKEKIKKQFNESLDRFKLCMKGECSRWEAMKAARDLGITAVALIAAVYVAAKAISPDYTPKVGEQYKFQSSFLASPRKITIQKVGPYNITFKWPEGNLSTRHLDRWNLLRKRGVITPAQ